MKKLSTFLIVLSISGLAHAAPELSKQLDGMKESIHIDPIEQNFDSTSLKEAISSRQQSLPIQKLNEDFQSLLKENGRSNREQVELDWEEVDLKAEAETQAGSMENEPKL